ncbi:MAG: four helix bundle protein [Saprospiraceae bacterium]
MQDDNFNQRFRLRTKKFSVDVYKFCESLPQTNMTRTVIYQLLKSSSSVAANWRAACRHRSQNEFFAKVCIVVEEADESEFWLEFISDTAINTTDERLRLEKEAHEILLISSTIKNKNNPNKK